MIEVACNQCGDPTPNFIQVSGKWLGNPVLYMGKGRLNYAMKYQFCDAECLIDWLAEVLGMEVK